MDPEIVHFDADAQEAERLGALSPTGWRARSVAAPLGPETAGEAVDAAVITTFIHSSVTAETLDRLPLLKLMATRSTGYDHIDLAACAAHGVTVSNVPTYGENTVAEHAFGLILALSRNIHRAWERTRRGDFSLEGLRGFDLQDRTLGVVGTGHIGLHVARIARGFGMKVVANDPNQNLFLADLVGFEYASLDRLLETSDIVSLHAPLLPSTRHMIDRERLDRMKPGALLINTGRGGLVDTAALLDALQSGRLGGAGLDVFEGEDLIHEETRVSESPQAAANRDLLRSQHELLRRENVVLTPHMAFFSVEAEERIRETTIQNIRSFLDGRPVNLVTRSA